MPGRTHPSIRVNCARRNRAGDRWPSRAAEALREGRGASSGIRGRLLTGPTSKSGFSDGLEIMGKTLFAPKHSNSPTAWIRRNILAKSPWEPGGSKILKLLSDTISKHH